jgi:hypothetical protein
MFGFFGFFGFFALAPVGLAPKKLKMPPAFFCLAVAVPGVLLDLEDVDVFDVPEADEEEGEEEEAEEEAEEEEEEELAVGLGDTSAAEDFMACSLTRFLNAGTAPEPAPAGVPTVAV